jgi:hypothetical protein
MKMIIPSSKLLQLPAKKTYVLALGAILSQLNRCFPSQPHLVHSLTGTKAIDGWITQLLGQIVRILLNTFLLEQ